MVASYVPVRALSRGMALLRALSQVGHATAADLAAVTDVDRTTTYRLMETLRRDGFVAYNEANRTYALTRAVRQLGDGFTDTDLTSQVVGPELGTLMAKVKWPSDFATFERGAMVIRESTHRFSPYSIHRAMIGRKRPFMRSALGRAVMAAAGPDERAQMLEMTIATGQPDAADARSALHVRRLIEEFAAKGYAASVDGSERGISAVALPVRGPTGVAGAINIIFFTSVMTPAQAAKRYLSALAEAICSVQRRLLAPEE